MALSASADYSVMEFNALEYQASSVLRVA